MISIIIPSMGRNERLDKMLVAIEEEVTSDSEIIVVMDLQQAMLDRVGFDCLVAMHPKVNYITTNIRGCWRCTNVGIEAAKNDFIMWTADDAMPHPGWFWSGGDCFRKNYPDGLGLLILNDLHMRYQVAGHAMTTKRFLEILYGEPKFPSDFNHYYCDTLTADRALGLDRLEFCHNSIIEHMHWQVGKSRRDKWNEIHEVDKVRTSDKAVKDALDHVWYNQGGRESSMKQLRMKINDHIQDSA